MLSSMQLHKFVHPLKATKVKSFKQITGELFSPVLKLLQSSLWTIFGLCIIDAITLWFVYQLVIDKVWFLGAAIFIVTLGVNIVFLNKKLYPLRWISPGLVLIILLALYPILFTIYSAFTNYSDGHLMTKTQTIKRLSQEYFLPLDSEQYTWKLFRSLEGDFALWLINEDGQMFWAKQNHLMQSVNQNEVPDSFDGYTQISQANTIKYLSDVEDLQFGQGETAVRIKSLKIAAQLQQRYIYDSEIDALIDQKEDEIYYANADVGSFIREDGQELYPGYQVPIGIKNFERLLNSPALRGPFLQVFVWTIVFAFLSVVTTFLLGLFLAMVLDSPGIHARKFFRSILILPYAIPGVILILIWRGLLNPHLGIINLTIANWIGWAPAWFSDPFWTKIGILLVNLYLGYPYMMLVCSGALKAIPQEIYEAAEVDGANAFQKFFKITLPFLLISVGPLLVSSFSFNYNNFNVIYLFNEGGPPIPNTPTPAGHSDILISYTYRLAFAGERGADYGYAAAIAFVIFVILSLITIFNFRFTRMWEEVSENV